MTVEKLFDPLKRGIALAGPSRNARAGPLTRHPQVFDQDTGPVELQRWRQSWAAFFGFKQCASILSYKLAPPGGGGNRLSCAERSDLARASWPGSGCKGHGKQGGVGKRSEQTTRATGPGWTRDGEDRPGLRTRPWARSGEAGGARPGWGRRRSLWGGHGLPREKESPWGTLCAGQKWHVQTRGQTIWAD